MRGSVLLCAAVVGLGCAVADDSLDGEARFFRDCVGRSYSSCQGWCPEEVSSDDVWDYWSWRVLGEKRMGGKPFKPCQERCYYEAHMQCTQANYDRGGRQAFKLFGRWPIRRVLIFEEFAAALFAALACVSQLFLYRRYEATVKKCGANAFSSLWRVYYAAWVATFASAFLFHTKDTMLTERLDYFSAGLTIVFILYLAITRIFVLRRSTQAFVAVPFGAFAAYHLYYMNFVSFDYGWNMQVLIAAAVLHGMAWTTWCLWIRPPHATKLLAPLLVMSAMSVFEIFDFPPLFGYLDPHSIWHLAIVASSVLWTRFIMAETEYLAETFRGRREFDRGKWQ
eukprot:TRINITY_DN2303_c0_g2_i1.p1 TRINITY_DN2303_c0_g2~~TRINITY_DN2303_c0_g2_i1.p1  ORF type:complete len:338 (+),score=75.59 TRINITY_DN2303_c0_g2_i1:102-1115(+)